MGFYPGFLTSSVHMLNKSFFVQILAFIFTQIEYFKALASVC